jgi:hypothetical protein
MYSLKIFIYILIFFTNGLFIFFANNEFKNVHNKVVCKLYLSQSCINEVLLIILIKVFKEANIYGRTDNLV